MGFCSKCGAKLVDGAKFCQKCGSAVIESSSNNEARKQEYAGKIVKCPNCGEVLNAFAAACPSCGFELRGTNSTNSVKELSRKLESIEARRETKKARFWEKVFEENQITKTDEQKISLIRSFPIPNTKEDLYEFLVMAKSNINVDVYQVNDKRNPQVAISDAWEAKYEQTYQKAQILLADDPRMYDIQKMYENTHVDINRSKKSSSRMMIKAWIIVILGWVVLITFMHFSNLSSNKKEAERLENIEAEIEVQLENGEYKYAMMNAEDLVFEANNADKEQVQKWKIRREYWIDKILEEAGNAGVKVDYTPNEESETKGE